MKTNLLFEELHPDELFAMVKSPSIIYLPLGTLEWHQAHLPFGLDALVSYHLCQESSKQTGGCVTPPLYWGTDREHLVGDKLFHGMDARAGKVLPGSIYFLKKELFYNVLVSITKSVADQGFLKLVVVSAHSGTAQQESLERLAQEKIAKLKILVFPGKLFSGGIDHAGRIETSLMLAIRPELVHMEKLRKPYDPATGEDPVLATKEEGLKRISEIVQSIVEKVSLHGLKPVASHPNIEAKPRTESPKTHHSSLD